MKERFCLVRDDVAHWYLIPAANRDEWDTWREVIENNPDVSLECPPWARPVNPHTLTFRDPEF